MPAGERVEPGDLVCGDCGAGNKPTRKFCRRCGHDLAEAEVAKVPWWRRLLPRRRQPLAGDRPRQSRTRGRSSTPYVVLGLVVLALVIAGLAFRDPIGEGYQRVVDRIVGSDPVRPTLSASASVRGAPAANAGDGTNNRFWSPGPAAEGEFLRARFDEPFRLLHVIITPGVSTKQPEFLEAGRPTVLSLAVTDQDGEVSRERLRLKDTAGPQPFDVTYADVETVRLTIVSSEPGSRPGAGVAIAEVEFLGR